MEAKSNSSFPNYGWVVSFAGFFMHLCLGTMYCWGTFTPYITSYLRKYDSSLGYSDTIICFLISPLAQAIGMPIGGLIERRLGPRITSLIGSLIMSFGVFISAYMTTVSSLMFTYGILYGIGMGIAYMCPIKCGMRWMPDRKGVVSGIVVTGFGLGGAAFNIIGAWICNPNNVQGTPFYGNDVARNVPKMFMVLGTIYAICTCIGALLLRDPTSEEARALAASNGHTADEEKPILQPSDHPKATDGVDLLGLLRDPRGYLLWAMMMCSTSSGVLVVGTYKSFGASAGMSDALLTMIGSLSLCFNGAGRLAYGALMDSIGYSKAMMICFFSQAVIASFFVSTTFDGLVYTACVCAMIANYGANFPMFPTVTATLFGTDFVAQNYGFVFLGFAAGSLLLKACLSSTLMSYSMVVYVTAVASAVAGFGVLALTPAQQKKIA
mmetsp:Transcript_6962/g.17073  ORF Transcript_6962/g.17073 Transcript_6962/m.17073 type:complete len:438 (-) Transcript_6962:242-1555(-)